MPRLTRAELRRRYGLRPDAAANARPRKLMVTHALQGASILRDVLDGRSKLGRAHKARIAALTADLGGEPSVAQSTLIDRASRLHLLVQLAWCELQRGTGPFKEGSPVPAVEAYFRAISHERTTLQMLGLERRARPAQDLQGYLAELAARKGEVQAAADAATSAEDAQLVEPTEVSTASPPEATTDGSAHPQPSAAA